jgi:UDP-N-acetylglucosamine transferase subunit ALG13
MRRSGRDPSDPPVRVLLVSSSGGHLAQLIGLRGWLTSGGHPTSWATFDTPDALDRLAGEDVTWAHHPTTRNLLALLRNLCLAWRDVRRHRPGLVVSTGAAIALPYFLVARLHRIRTAYVEVCDRLETRTLTARLCGPLSEVFCVQHPDQLALYPGAHLIGSLLPEPAARSTVPPDGPPEVLVTLGTDLHPCDRLVDWSERAASATPGTTWSLQHGRSRSSSAMAASDYLSHDEFLAALRRAAVVVTHAGPGTIAEARSLGVPCVVVPRDPALGEHVDDHQLRYGAHIEGEPGVRVARSAEELLAHVRDHLAAAPSAGSTAPARPADSASVRFGAIVLRTPGTGAPSGSGRRLRPRDGIR